MNPSQIYHIHPAAMTDYPGIQTLLESVNLSVEGVQEHLDQFITISEANEMVGVVGLEIYGDKAILRSLAVDKNSHGKGYGRQLTDRIIQKAQDEKISELYLLTETAETFFARFGFERISRELVDDTVKTSLQFQLLCPESAPCMRLQLINS